MSDDERIWADGLGVYGVEYHGATPYIRADLYDSLAKERDELRAEVERLVAIIRRIDRVTPKADKTCDEPGISISEAVQREWPSLRCAALQRKEGTE